MRKNFLHSGARGDIVYSLPSIRALGGGVLHLRVGVTHGERLSEPLSQDDVVGFRYLLCGQHYIDDVVEWNEGDRIDYVLDGFRKVLRPSMLISRAHLITCGVDCNLQEPWLDLSDIPVIEVKEIIINRTMRYKGKLNWEELAGLQSRCSFVGMDNEYEDFRRETGLREVSFYDTKGSYIVLASVMRGSKLFIGNQSFPYAIAEAMKVNRVLESYAPSPNCLPQGRNGWTQLTQDVLHQALQ